MITKVRDLQLFLQESSNPDNNAFVSCEGIVEDAEGAEKHISFKINDLETVAPILRRTATGDVELIELEGNAYGPRARMPRRESGTLALGGLRPAKDKDGNLVPPRTVKRQDDTTYVVHSMSFSDVEVCVAPTTSSLTFVRKAARTKVAQTPVA
jgi:hypothetical protein